MNAARAGMLRSKIFLIKSIDYDINSIYRAYFMANYSFFRDLSYNFDQY